MLTNQYKKNYSFLKKYLLVIVMFFLSNHLSFSQSIEKIYRENTFQLLKENKINEIKVEYYGNRKLPYFNIWETLYFHLKKNEFDLFFTKITEYTRYLENYNGEIIYFNQRSPDNKEYLLEWQTKDELWSEVKSIISRQPEELLSSLNLSSIDSEQHDFVELFVHFMVWHFYRLEDEIDYKIDNLSRSFIMNYPGSEKLEFIDKFILPRAIKGRVKVMMDVGAEYTMLNGVLGEHIAPKSGFAFSTGMQVSYKNIFGGITMSAHDGIINQSFNYQSPWVQDSNFFFLNFDVTFGYSHRLQRNLSILPYVGYRYSNITYSYKDALDENLDQSISLSSNSPLVGCYFDIEFAHRNWEGLTQKTLRDSYSQNYYGLRLGVSYAFNNFGRYTPELTGNTLMISMKFMMSFMWSRKRRALD